VIDKNRLVEQSKEHIYRNYPVFAKDNKDGFDWILDHSVKEARASYRKMAGFARVDPRFISLGDHDILDIAFETLLVALCKNKIDKAERDLLELANELRGLSRSGVFFIGAGISFGSKIDWFTIRDCVLACFQDMPRDYVEGLKEDWDAGGQRRERVWQELENKGKEPSFRRALHDNLTGRYPKSESPHVHLAFLIEQSIVEHLVCFNWDDLIEKACQQKSIGLEIRYRDESGRPIDWFWKPHGCVNRLDLDFVLPHQEVFTNQDFIEAMRISPIAPRARVVVCIGFSGDERFNKERLREIVGSPPEVYDVRPSIGRFGELGRHVPMVASYALQRIVERMQQ